MDIAAQTRPEFRFSGALPLAALTTLSLLFGMQQLIKQDYTEPEPDTGPRLIDVVMPERIIEPLPDLPQKVVEPETPPVTPPLDTWQPPQTGGGFLPPKGTKIDPVKPKIGIGGGGLVKQVMIAPEYPRRLLERGIEGFVDVQYDVTAYGTTENLQVLHAEPEGAFERAALAAVAKWKFRPQVIDDEAVATYGLKERVRFSIEK